MSIDVIQSQKPEILLAHVIAELSVPSAVAADIFKKKYFIVPSHGVGQWLKQNIAQQQGISANLQFEALRTFQWSLYQLILGSEPISKAPQMLNMKWKIFLFLSQFIDQKLATDHPLQGVFDRIYQHSQGMHTDLERQTKQKSMLYWVADQTSRLFANYMIYRGQCVQACENICQCRQNWLAYWGRDQALNIEKWIRKPEKEILELQPEMLTYAIQQAQSLEVWQRFIWNTEFAEDFAQMQQLDDQFWQKLDGADSDFYCQKLPPQVYVFTMLELPPSQLYFLRRLAQFISVKIFHYSASQEYWADSVDPKWKERYKLTQPHAAVLYESRHPLLTRLGKQARDISALLTQLSGGEEGLWEDRFPEELPTNLLQQLQTDILYLNEPQANAYHLMDDDQSIQIHVCHSSLRQLEVLKDQLIQWLVASDERQRSPDDIVILVPNLQDIEPLIRTVFAANHENSQVNLPVKIAGVPQLDAVQLWQAIRQRIELLQGRFQLEELIDWLSLIPIQEHYRLNFDDIQRIKELLQFAGFKRGFDTAHLSLTLSKQDQDNKFTFRYALDRLVLAIAMPEHAIFNDVLSLTEIRRSDFDVISTLVQVFDDLDARRDWLYAESIDLTYGVETEYALSQAENHTNTHAGILALLKVLDLEIEKFVEATGYQQVKDAVRKLKRIIETTQAESARLSLNYLIEEIANTIAHQISQTEPTGQITFAQMGQLRPLPYRLVVCLNMDTGTFPNRDTKIPFDLMELLRPELGDRSRFEDDQGSFLDAMLLAQDSIWLFYNGYDVNDAEVRDPSSIVQELVDHLKNIVYLTVDEAAVMELKSLSIPTQLKQLYYVHPLQPFEPNDFIRTDVQRFNDQWFDVAQSIVQPHKKAFHWLFTEDTASLIEMPKVEESTLISSTQWIKDLSFPAEHFLRVKGIAQIEMISEIDTLEPLQLNGLQRYQVREYLQQNTMHVNEEHTVDYALLQDKLPVGKMQNATLHVALTEQEVVRQRLSQYGEITQTTRITWRYDAQTQFDLRIPEQPETERWVSLSASSCHGERPLHVWLEYLLWRASTDNGQNLQRIALYKNKTLIFSGLKQSEAQQQVKLWLSAWKMAEQAPFVLPPKLFADVSKDAPKWELDASGRWYCENISKLDEIWQGIKFYHSDHENKFLDKASSKHPAWLLTVIEDEALTLFHQYVEKYAADLYQPLHHNVQIITEL